MPDGLLASPQRVFMASSHRAVAGSLLHGLRDPGAVTALTGEAGLGKSLLLRHVLEETGGSVLPMLRVLTVRGKAGTAPAAWESLRRDATPQGPGLVMPGLLVIEDAHEMCEAQLSDMATLFARSPPAQGPRLVFVARPQFWLNLSAPGLEGLREAIGTRAVLFPMAYADAERYLAHLFRRAGASPRAILDEPSLHALLLRAQGNPHRINVELSQVLAAASLPDVRRAAPRPRRRGRVAAALLAAATLGGAALAALDTSELPGDALGAVHSDSTRPAPVRPQPLPPPDPGLPGPAELAADPPSAQQSDVPPVADAPPVPDVPDVPAPQAASPIAVSAAPPALPDGVIAVLIRRGDGMLALKDVAAARLFYERAARSGSAAAALLLGSTYDPALVDGDRADPQIAAAWYGLAATLGNPDAPARLKRVAAPAPAPAPG